MKLTNKSLGLKNTRSIPDPFARSIARVSRKLAPEGQVVCHVDGNVRDRFVVSDSGLARYDFKLLILHMDPFQHTA